MVSQEVVQQAMEEIGAPCTSNEIVQHLIDKGKISKFSKSELVLVDRKLQRLRRWEVVAITPHLKGNNNINYLISSGYKHDENNCEQCKIMIKNHNMRTRQLMNKLQRRKTSYKNRDDMESSPDSEYWRKKIGY
jgi:hypothetical protein